MTRERIDALEVDKDHFKQCLGDASREIARLSPENAQLKEELHNAATNNVIATILIALGGGAMGYASFAGGVGRQVVLGGIGLLSAGVIILAVSTYRRASM